MQLDHGGRAGVQPLALFQQFADARLVVLAHGEAHALEQDLARGPGPGQRGVEQAQGLAALARLPVRARAVDARGHAGPVQAPEDRLAQGGAVGGGVSRHHRAHVRRQEAADPLARPDAREDVHQLGRAAPVHGRQRDGEALEVELVLGERVHGLRDLAHADAARRPRQHTGQRAVALGEQVLGGDEVVRARDAGELGEDGKAVGVDGEAARDGREFRLAQIGRAAGGQFGVVLRARVGEHVVQLQPRAVELRAVHARHQRARGVGPSRHEEVGRQPHQLAVGEAFGQRAEIAEIAPREQVLRARVRDERPDQKPDGPRAVLAEALRGDLGVAEVAAAKRVVEQARRPQRAALRGLAERLQRQGVLAGAAVEVGLGEQDVRAVDLLDVGQRLHGVVPFRARAVVTREQQEGVGAALRAVLARVRVPDPPHGRTGELARHGDAARVEVAAPARNHVVSAQEAAGDRPAQARQRALGDFGHGQVAEAVGQRHARRRQAGAGGPGAGRVGCVGTCGHAWDRRRVRGCGHRCGSCFRVGWPQLPGPP